MEASQDGTPHLPLTLAMDRRRSRSAQIYDELRRAIVRVDLVPGTPLSENRLCRQLGVSRTPVREAIIRLSQEGLIDVFPQHGSFVARIDLQLVDQAHFVRAALELAIMRQAAPVWTAAAGRRLRTVLLHQQAMAEAGDRLAFNAADYAFHEIFAACAGRAAASRMIADIQVQLDRVRLLATSLDGHMEKILREHGRIAAALDALDASAAVAALVDHLETVHETTALLALRHPDYFVPTAAAVAKVADA